MFTLRPAVPGDAAFLWQLHAASMRDAVAATWGWDEAWQRADVERRLSSGSVEVVEVDGAAVGMLEVEERPSETWIANLQMMPAWRGRGLGAAVVRDVLARAARRGVPVTLQVLERSQRIHRLYRRLGFEDVSATPPFVLMRHAAVPDEWWPAAPDDPAPPPAEALESALALPDTFEAAVASHEPAASLVLRGFERWAESPNVPVAWSAKVWVSSGAFAAAAVPFWFSDLDLEHCIATLRSMRDTLEGMASLSDPHESPFVRLEMLATGRVEVDGLLEHDLQQLRFSFVTDQTALAPFADALEAVRGAAPAARP